MENRSVEPNSKVIDIIEKFPIGQHVLVPKTKNLKRSAIEGVVSGHSDDKVNIEVEVDGSREYHHMRNLVLIESTGGRVTTK